MKARRDIDPFAIGAALLVLALLIASTIAWGSPDPSHAPPPPDWLSRAAAEFIAQVAPILYWEMATVLLAVYEVLRWQRATNETSAARWYRRFQLSKALFWLTLAVGRTLLHEWLTVGFVVIVIYIFVTLNRMALAMITTYAVPLFRCRGGRCTRELPPPLDVMRPPRTDRTPTTE